MHYWELGLTTTTCKKKKNTYKYFSFKSLESDVFSIYQILFPWKKLQSRKCYWKRKCDNKSSTHLKYFTGKHFFSRNPLTLWLYLLEMSLVYKWFPFLPQQWPPCLDFWKRQGNTHSWKDNLQIAKNLDKERTNSTFLFGYLL